MLPLVPLTRPQANVCRTYVRTNERTTDIQTAVDIIKCGARPNYFGTPTPFPPGSVHSDVGITLGYLLPFPPGSVHSDVGITLGHLLPFPPGGVHSDVGIILGHLLPFPPGGVHSDVGITLGHLLPSPQAVYIVMWALHWDTYSLPSRRCT